MVFENSIVLGTVDEFIDYAMVVVAIFAVVYLVRFLLAVRGKDDGEKDKKWHEEGERMSKAVSEKYNALKEKEIERKKAESEAKKKEKEAAAKKTASPKTAGARVKAEKRVKDKVTSYLMNVITLIDDCIKHLNKNESKEAGAAFAKAKRRLTSARNSQVLEELADNTPHLAEAKAIHSHIVTLRSELDKISTLDIPTLKKINTHLGAIHLAIGELIRKIFT